MGNVIWDGHHIMVFPDCSKLVTEKWAAFNQCKCLLIYLALLTQMVEGRSEFTDPKKVLDYICSLPP